MSIWASSFGFSLHRVILLTLATDGTNMQLHYVKNCVDVCSGISIASMLRQKLCLNSFSSMQCNYLCCKDIFRSPLPKPFEATSLETTSWDYLWPIPHQMVQKLVEKMCLNSAHFLLRKVGPFLGSVFGSLRTDFSRIFILGPPDFFRGFCRRFYFSSFLWEKSVKRKKSPASNRNPRHISSAGGGNLVPSQFSQCVLPKNCAMWWRVALIYTLLRWLVA